MASVAVIGGGISGLSCAYYLRKLGRDVIKKVTLSERQTSLGGWIQTSRFPDGTVYEHGPTSIRPSGAEGCNTLELVEDLGLSSEILHVSSSHPSALQRLILTNDKLHQLPNHLSNLFLSKEPFHRPLILFILKDLLTRKGSEDDESFDAFARRRFGSEIADLVVDPMCRGVAAGSSKEISIRSLMPNVFHVEREHGSVIRGMLKRARVGTPAKYLHSDQVMISKRDKWAMWTLKKGLQDLPNTLEAHLQKDDAIQLYHNIPCERIQFEDGKALVHFEGVPAATEFDHVFACVPAKKMSQILCSHHPSLANHLSAISSVHVAVVNLEYQGKLCPVNGFGYLVPSHQKSKILGAIFNSCIFPEQDGSYADKTRFTVMMGGKWFRDNFGDIDSVSPESLLQTAVSEVSQHLGIREEPVRHQVRIQRNCIAQYRVGHHKILESAEREIGENSMCLTLTGASYNGLSINDCIYNGRIAVENFLETLRS